MNLFGKNKKKKQLFKVQLITGRSKAYDNLCNALNFSNNKWILILWIKVDIWIYWSDEIDKIDKINKIVIKYDKSYNKN